MREVTFYGEQIDILEKCLQNRLNGLSLIIKSMSTSHPSIASPASSSELNYILSEISSITTLLEIISTKDFSNA
jgi:hypothetical protein